MKLPVLRNTVRLLVAKSLVTTMSTKPSASKSPTLTASGLVATVTVTPAAKVGVAPEELVVLRYRNAEAAPENTAAISSLPSPSKSPTDKAEENAPLEVPKVTAEPNMAVPVIEVT